LFYNLQTKETIISNTGEFDEHGIVWSFQVISCNPPHLPRPQSISTTSVEREPRHTHRDVPEGDLPEQEGDQPNQVGGVTAHPEAPESHILAQPQSVPPSPPPATRRYPTGECVILQVLSGWISQDSISTGNLLLQLNLVMKMTTPD
jgi:hypothetical protein